MSPSWLHLPSLRTHKSRSKHSSSSSTTSTTSSHSSTTSSPLTTPPGSTIWTSATETCASPVKTTKGRLGRKRKDTQPRPIGPRLSSLFFPTSSLSAEQEDRCIYRATSHAASLSDLLLLSGGGGRPVSGLWASGGGKQSNFTTLDLTTIHTPVPHYEYNYEYEYDNKPLPAVPTPTYPYRSPNNRHTLSFADFSALGAVEEDPLRPPAPPFAAAGRRQSRKSVDYSSMMEAMGRKERAYSTSGQGIERGAEIWSSPFDSETDLPGTSMLPPPVPARSNLRPTASASNLRDRFSKSGPSGGVTPAANMSVETLPSRPVTSSRYSSSPETVSRPTMTASASSTSTESAFSIGRKKRSAVRGGSISGDPNRIKDGAAARESASGVYTPSTFPGPFIQQPPKPSSSRVYTPSSFPAPSPTISSLPLPSPSRSTSVSSTSTTSSAEVTTPRTPHTPLTPGSRFLGAVSGGWGNLKRVSGALSTKSAATPSPTYTPTSAREGYFQSTIYESSAASGPSFWPKSAPGTPATGSSGSAKPYGLGLGLATGPMSTEDKRRSRSETITSASEKFGGVLVGDVPKGKRKPVPKPVGQVEIKEEETAEEEHVGYAV